MMGNPSVHFNHNSRQIIAWRARLLDRPANGNDPDPGDHYARALPVLKALLADSAPWHEVSAPPGMSFKFVGVTRYPPELALPAHTSGFTYGHRNLFELKCLFGNPSLFRPYLDRQHGLILEVLNPAARDIFYHLQLLFPGMLLILHDTPIFSNHPNKNLTRTRRGVPPVEWILANHLALKHIFGQAYLHAFLRGAEDPSRAHWTTVCTPDWVRISVLPVDGLLMKTRGWTHNADLTLTRTKTILCLN